MKKIIYLLVSAFVFFSFASCNNNDAANEAWKDTNWKEYQKVVANTQEYHDIRLTFNPTDGTGPLGVYFKELKKGTGKEHPIQTSFVQILYSGRYPGVDSIYFNKGSKDNGVPALKMVNNTDPSFSSDYFMTRGLSFAIQNMVIGDRWEIWVPYYLGFGTVGLTDSYGSTLIIKGYSTLVYDVELVSINNFGK